MADEIIIDVKGLKEVERKLGQYSVRLRNVVVQRAMREGAKVILKQARKNAPKGTRRDRWNFPGRLRRGLIIRNSKLYAPRKNRGKVGVYIDARKNKGGRESPKDAFYANFVEHGTQFMTARRFMKRAFETKRREAASVAVRASEIGADIVARRTGIK